MARRRRYWLFKSEPEEFSFDDLKEAPGQTEGWDGVRNYQARNLLRDEIKSGDRVLFYHSRGKSPAVVGIAEVVRDGYPDPTAFDPKAKYYDPKSSPEEPRWYQVDVRYVEPLSREVPLAELRQTPGLEDMPLLRRGNRLSVQPVGAKEFQQIVRMSKKKPSA